MAMSLRSTRYPELQYQQQSKGVWRFYNEGHAVGPQYASERELLADMRNYAVGWGHPNPEFVEQDVAAAIRSVIDATIERIALAENSDPTKPGTRSRATQLVLEAATAERYAAQDDDDL
jgi:hypothetical protein